MHDNSGTVFLYSGMRRVEHAHTDFPDTFSAAPTHLWLPPAALGACVRAVLTRDTRGIALAAHQRYNHIPASPLCAIVWYFTGHAELLAADTPALPDSPRTPLPPVSFCGPSLRPLITWNPGEMHTLVLLLLPDALSSLTGIDPGRYVNQCISAESLFDADWQNLFHAVVRAGDDEQRAHLIASFLQPRWQAVRPDHASISHYYADWSQNLMLRAATSGFGRSLRQMERRIKQWAGLPYRELRGLGRAEQAFFDAAMTSADSAVNWSDVASKTGYADQSHFCRQTRRITGFTPEALRRRIFTDETFWIYRLWGLAEQLPD